MTTTASALSFVHRYEPPHTTPDGTTLLLLHGTGGDESDLLPLGSVLNPRAGLLSPLGKVAEQGASRFFRRIKGGGFDARDRITRTQELAQFVEAASAHYGLDPTRIVGVGFSNGATAVASLLLLRPGILSAAALFAPSLPFVPNGLPDLVSAPVYIGAGRSDTIAQPERTMELVELLRRARANVQLSWHKGGHTLTPEQVTEARDWLESHAF